MLKFIKSLFTKVDDDKNLTLMRKNFSGNYKQFDDVERAVLRLRLSGMDPADIADALSITAEKARRVENEIIRKITK